MTAIPVDLVHQLRDALGSLTSADRVRIVHITELVKALFPQQAPVVPPLLAYHIQHCDLPYKIFGLYALDSIVKNVPEYRPLIEPLIHQIFTRVYMVIRQHMPDTLPMFEKVFRTWFDWRCFSVDVLRAIARDLGLPPVPSPRPHANPNSMVPAGQPLQPQPPQQPVEPVIPYGATHMLEQQAQAQAALTGSQMLPIQNANAMLNVAQASSYGNGKNPSPNPALMAGVNGHHGGPSPVPPSSSNSAASMSIPSYAAPHEAALSRLWASSRRIISSKNDSSSGSAAKQVVPLWKREAGNSAFFARSWWSNAETWLENPYDVAPFTDSAPFVFGGASATGADLTDRRRAAPEEGGNVLTSDVTNEACPVCGERFDVYFDDDEQEFAYSGTVKDAEGRAVHRMCAENPARRPRLASKT
jgi:hypothetical protein